MTDEEAADAFARQAEAELAEEAQDDADNTPEVSVGEPADVPLTDGSKAPSPLALAELSPDARMYRKPLEKVGDFGKVAISDTGVIPFARGASRALKRVKGLPADAVVISDTGVMMAATGDSASLLAQAAGVGMRYMQNNEPFAIVPSDAGRAAILSLISSGYDIVAVSKDGSVTVTQGQRMTKKAVERAAKQRKRFEEDADDALSRDLEERAREGGTSAMMSVAYDELMRMPTMSADGVEPITDKATLKAAFRAFGDVRNADDGRVARFPAASAGKFLTRTGERAEFVLPLLGVLYRTGKHLFSEKEEDIPNHKKHREYISYHHYINKVIRDGKEYYVRLTVTEQPGNGDTSRNEIHSGIFSQVSVYDTNGDVITVLGKEPSGDENAPFVDEKVANWLKKNKPQSSATMSVGADPAERERAKREMDEVRRKYQGTDAWMKARPTASPRASPAAFGSSCDPPPSRRGSATGRTPRPTPARCWTRTASHSSSTTAPNTPASPSSTPTTGTRECWAPSRRRCGKSPRGDRCLLPVKAHP